MISVMPLSINGFAYVPDVGPGHCVANCDAPDYSSSSSSSYSSYSYDSYSALGDSFYQLGQSLGQSIADSWAQAAANQQTGLSYNSYGNSALATGNWDDAISQYEQALAYLPNNYVVQQNLKKAKSGRSNKQGADAHARGDYESALYYYRESLEMDPGDHVVRNNYRVTKKMQRQKNAHERADRLETLMAETSRELQKEFGDVTTEAENVSAPREIDFNALNAISSNPNAGKGLRIKSDIPMPIQRESAEDRAFKFDKIKDMPEVDKAIELANQASVKWEETKEWVGDQVEGGVKAKLIETIESQMPETYHTLKGIKEETEALYEKIGGEHKKTASGAFDLMREGVDEAGSTSVTGVVDEKIDRFIDARAAGYTDMADEIISDKVGGKVDELTQFEEPDWTAEKSTVVSIDNKKSYDRERAEYLNKHAR